MVNVFGKALKELRGNKPLREIEKKSGVTSSYLCKLENGLRNPPKPKTLRKLAPALGVSYARLLLLAGYLDVGANDGEEEA